MPLKIYKRGDFWHYRGTVAGRRLRGSTGAQNRETAARIAAEIESRQWKCRLDGPKAVLTFAQAAINYRAAGKPTRFLDKIEDYWKDTLVKDITAGSIQAMARTLYPNAGPATRNRQAIVPAQAIINHAAEADLCSPIRVKRFPVTTKVKKPVTLEWLEAFMAHARPDMAVLALFLFLTGCRISEALAVRWDDVDLQMRAVLIRQTKIGAERTAHIPQRLVLALANLRRWKNGKVFRYKTRGAALNAWRDAITAAGIERLSFHSCRHGFATALLQAGIDPVTVSKLGGWKTPKLVFQTYGHASDDMTLTEKLLVPKLTRSAPPKSKKQA